MEPNPSQLILFIDLLTKNGPPGYKPWLFKLERHSKTPIRGPSWKAETSRLTLDEAVTWMVNGGNIGIAGMENDNLVCIDLDGKNVDKKTLKKTLTTRSRSRTGIHGFYWGDKKEIPNIPTDNDGEVRCNGQYVVCAGSYVPVDDIEKISPEQRVKAGYYTVEDLNEPVWITYDELPRVFIEAYEARRVSETKKVESFDPKQSTGNYSALFDVTAEEIMLREVGYKKPGERWGSLLHDSKTEANMSISTRGLLHCWRHSVSHNGLSALTVMSGYMSCLEAGTPHKGGQSKIVGDDGAIFHAWLEAKKRGYIASDDSIPVRALHHIAKKHLGYETKKDELMPTNIYIEVLTILEELY